MKAPRVEGKEVRGGEEVDGGLQKQPQGLEFPTPGVVLLFGLVYI